ncbi:MULTISPECIES: heme exporter protein CcmD [unclassified Marinobacter]|uniref:heme exporter protein CcmD n=1 Tax=unclassified Marinobacter TaxID=83889 RepID=UPI0026E38001|nr:MULTISPECIES: heme exporter protein CcmD [unclassified Marinobacter]MDO6440782.1 heme exporter protein CcmD [Marinobacter sp. 2_MG-2023]MDO6823609.1 heme exporter protein CcmD [Marinobacter sp. 1_MG-2023]
MAFDSFSAFIAMEGHGPYVWACYAVFFVLMLLMMIGSVRSRKAIVESCRRGYEFQADKSKVAASPPPSASFARVNVSQD